mgnify:CR=1 FL=1
MADDDSLPPDDAPPPDDVEALKAALAKANDDAKRHRLRNKELEPFAAKVKELEDANKSELDKLRDEIATRDAALNDLPKQVRQQVVRFASEATRQGFLDPEDALLNMSDVDLSDNDAVKASLAALAERKPHLVREAKPQPKVPARPTAGAGQHLGTPAGDAAAKEQAAAALRVLRGTP